MASLFRTTFGKSILVAKCSSEHIPVDWEKSEIIYLSVPNFAEKDYVEVLIPTTIKGIRFYLNTENNLYLSGFDYDQDLINHPIDAIRFQKMKISIFAGQKLMKIKPKQLQTPHYLEENLPTIPTRIAPDCEEDFSDEFEESFLSTSKESSSTLRNNNSEDFNENMSTTSNETAHFENDFGISMLDRKLIRKTELEGFISQMEELFDHRTILNENSVVSSTKLICTKDVVENDPIVVRCANELKNSSSLSEYDPIVVVPNGDDYNVVSGNKRALAYQMLGVNTVRVSNLSTAVLSKFRLNRFFCNSNSKEEITIHETINIFYELMSYLNLSHEILEKWNAKEVGLVFGPFFGKSTRISEIFRLFLQKELADSILRLCDPEIKFNAYSIRETTRKYIQNNESVLELLQKRVVGDNEQEFQKNLRSIQPDLRCVLSRKIFQNQLIDTLVEKYQGDDIFLSFARGTDFRKRGKDESTAIKNIVNRFELYKKNCNPADVPVKVLHDVSMKESNFVITSQQITVDNFLDGTKDGICIIMGSHNNNGSTHTLILPNKCSPQDEFGCFHNSVSITVYFKEGGEMIQRSSMNEKFDQFGVPFSQAILLSDVQLFVSGFQRSFIDVPDELISVVTALVNRSGMKSIVVNKSSQMKRFTK